MARRKSRLACMKILAIDPTEPDELADPEEDWEHAMRLQNDIDYWLYKAYTELGLLDQELAITIMDYLHEEMSTAETFWSAVAA